MRSTHLTCLFALTVLLCTCSAPVSAVEPHNPLSAGELPQYIFFHRSQTVGDADRWNQHAPKRFTKASVEDIPNRIGSRGNDKLRVGVMFTFSLLDIDGKTLAESVQALLKAAESADVPVFVCLDGQNWWQSRSDLWNWWDPNLPGFNPDNRQNVEWTGWSPDNAVKIGWRNWGSQIRVRPAQNIFAPKVLAEYWKQYDVAVPVIVKWYQSLPANRKYLFGGVKLGWEASTNVNAYYYPDGNRIFEQHPDDTSHDPKNMTMEKGWTGGVQPLGYAAVATAGVKQSGVLTPADIEKAVHRYLDMLCKEGIKRGLPRHMIFTHQGGTFAPWEKNLSFKPAINDDSIPGWSFYTHEPQESGSLDGDLKTAGREQWAACEWWRPSDTEAGWREHIDKALRFKQCRLIGVYNWESFRQKPEALRAVAALLNPATATTRPAK